MYSSGPFSPVNGTKGVPFLCHICQKPLGYYATFDRSRVYLHPHWDFSDYYGRPMKGCMIYLYVNGEEVSTGRHHALLFSDEDLEDPINFEKWDDVYSAEDTCDSPRCNDIFNWLHYKHQSSPGREDLDLSFVKEAKQLGIPLKRPKDWKLWPHPLGVILAISRYLEFQLKRHEKLKCLNQKSS